MSNVDVKNMITRVVKGEEASQVVDSLTRHPTDSVLTEVRGRRLVCVSCKTEFPFEDAPDRCTECQSLLTHIAASAHPVEVRTVSTPWPTSGPRTGLCLSRRCPTWSLIWLLSIRSFLLDVEQSPFQTRPDRLTLWVCCRPIYTLSNS
jgi:hypothetical protein